jgi:Flp pilus assembly protein TadD
VGARGGESQSGVGGALNTLAVIYERHGNKPLAERAYRAALLREPENLNTLRNLQPVLSALGKTDEALAVAKRLASLEPVAPFEYFHQGVAAYRAGQYGKARDLFRGKSSARPTTTNSISGWRRPTCSWAGQTMHARNWRWQWKAAPRATRASVTRPNWPTCASSACAE